MRTARFIALYRRHFQDHRRERMVLASVSFFITFATARLLVHGFRTADRAFEVWIGGIHLHHYVWGILLLLTVGYLWLIQVGIGANQASHRLGRVTSILYGVGAALTLDEFAIWLHLEDVYWERTGRASIDAVMLFGALVSAGLWGGPFWRAALRQIGRVFGRRPQPSVTSALGTEPVVRRLEEILLAPGELAGVRRAEVSMEAGPPEA